MGDNGSKKGLGARHFLGDRDEAIFMKFKVKSSFNSPVIEIQIFNFDYVASLIEKFLVNFFSFSSSLFF